MKNKKGSIPLDELAKKCLESNDKKAIPDVDVGVKKIEFEFSVKEFKIIFRANQISIAILVVELVTLITLLRG